MASKFYLLSLSVVLPLWLGGCAHQNAVKNLADLTAARVDDLKSQMDSFVGRSNTMRKDSSDRLDLLDERTEATAIDTSAIVQEWKAEDDEKSKRALIMFEALTAFGRTDALPVTDSGSAASAPPNTLVLNAGQYEVLIKDLKALGSPKTLWDEGIFLGGFGKAVSDSYSTDIAKAQAAVTKAAASGQTVSAQTPLPQPISN